MEYGKAISDAFSYARHTKATLAFSAFFIAVSAIALVLAALLLPASGLSTNPLYWLKNPAALGPPTILVVLFAIATLAIGGLALTGTVIRNAVHAESLSESWKQFTPRLGTLLGIVAITMAVSFASSMLFETLMKMVPAAYGVFFVLSIAVSLALALFLAFAEYAAVLDGTGVYDSLRRSIDVASRKPMDVFLALLVSSVVAFILLLVIIVFLLLVAVGLLLVTRSTVQTLSVPTLLAFGIVGIVAVIGVFFTHVFQYHFMANAFVDIGGKPKEQKEESDARKKKDALTKTIPAPRKRSNASKRASEPAASKVRKTNARRST